VRPDDRGDDRQTQPCTAAFAGTRGIAAGEPLENLGLQRRRDTRTVVDDLQHGVRRLGAQPRRHDGAGAGVDAGVGEQIGQHLVQPCRITGDDHRLLGQVKLPLVIRPGNVRVTDRVDRQPRKIHGLTFQRSAGVQARQQQQVLNEARHPLGLGCHPAHRVRHRLAVVVHALGEFGIAADRGERRAQFVTGIGDELANPGFTGLPRGQGVRDVVEHAVQCRSELAHLGLRVRVGFGHAHRQFDFSAGQRQVRDLARGLCDATQRRQRPPDDDDACGGRGGQRDHRDDPEDDQHPDHRGVDVGHRQAGNDDVTPAPARRGDDAISTEAVEAQGHRRATAGDVFQLCSSGWRQRRPGTVAGQVTGVDRLPMVDHRRHHAGRLARGVEEPRTGARPRIERVPVVRFGIHQRRAIRGPGELPVELSDQVVVQREFSCRRDPDTHQGEHDDLPDEQP